MVLVAYRKRLEVKSEPGLAEAAEKARELIRGLQSRLRTDGPGEAGEEDLERQLHEYFERARPNGGTLNEMRNRVVDGVVEKILRRWEQPQRGSPSALEEQVVEKLIERVLERMQSSARH